MNIVTILARAEEELLESALFYQSMAPGLGQSFVDEVERAIRSIILSPRTWPIFEGQLRRRLLRRFPFGVIYQIEPDEIVIIAIAHLRKRPGYWKDDKKEKSR